jgi:signal transduction histidine kinase
VAELSKANDRLRELDAARSAFYRNISHELATPMTPIVGYARLLLDEELGELAPAQKRALAAMEECIARLRRIIDNLLDVTGLETGRMRFAQRQYDFAATAARAVEDVRARAQGADLRLAVEVPTAGLPAVGDDERLYRAMAQLLDNALKFTPASGAVGVRVRTFAQGYYELCVADTGAGVPQEQHERIFDAFYQVDGSVTREHGGTGVGLAIARRTARGLGGDLHCVSPASEYIAGMSFLGAAFYLTVAPQAPNEAALAAARL